MSAEKPKLYELAEKRAKMYTSAIPDYLATRDNIKKRIDKIKKQVNSEQNLRLIQGLGKQKNGRSSKYRFSAHDPVLDTWTESGMSANTLYHKLKENSDLELFMYVNPMKKVGYQTKKTWIDHTGKKFEKLVWRSKYEPESFGSFVFEIVLNDCKTIQDVIDLYIRIGLPLPKAITQFVGKIRFQIWVTAENLCKTWTTRNKVAYVLTLLEQKFDYKGFNPASMAEDIFLANKLVPEELTEHHGNHKFRISSLRFLGEDGYEPKILALDAVETWYNPQFFEYMYKNGEASKHVVPGKIRKVNFMDVPEEIVHIFDRSKKVKKFKVLEERYPEKPVTIVESPSPAVVEVEAEEPGPVRPVKIDPPMVVINLPATKYDKFYSRVNEKFDKDYKKGLVKLILRHISSDKAVDAFATMILTYRGCLFKKQLRISTPYLAEVLGVTKMTVSRYIKTLVDAGIIEVMDGGAYRIKKFARKYGPGKALISFFKKGKKTPKTTKLNKFARLYKTKKTEKHFLSDIRFCYYNGFSAEQTAALLLKKYALSGFLMDDKIEKMEGAWWKFSDVAKYPPAQKPKIQYNELMDRLCA